MFKYLIAVLLLTATIQQDATVFLTPPYPPTAFYQQYYEVRFRVRGQDAPTFTFDNLPNFLSGSADGVLSGTPNITGTFKISITYSDGVSTGTSKVVISVTGSPNTDVSAKQSSDVTFLVIQNAIESWIYRSGQSISIQLNANGTAPITWNYENLPKGLSGDNSGRIVGSCSDAGLYGFSVSAGDSKGLKAVSYYTLNIQPGTIIKTNNILDVPNQNVPVVYDLSQVEAQQIAADNAVAKALRGVAEAKAVAQAQQAAQGRTQAALNLAADQENAAEVTFAKAQDIYNAAENTIHIAEANLNTAKNVVAIATTALKNADAVLAAAKANLAAAQANFDAATKVFNEASAAETAALNALTQAQADYNTAVANVKDAQNAYNIAWTNVQTAKAALDEANNKLLQANADVINAKNALGLATQANDDAQTHLNGADAALTAAQHNLEDANAAVADLRGQSSVAETSLGTAKFNYNQALNALYVAQAAKEASDKAIAIAYAQGAAATDIFKGESTYVFSGCLNQAYPSIAGTVSVVNLIPSGAQLSSGHILTWGECTTKDTINIGDVIYYQGSIVGNCISATSVAKQA